MSEKAYAKRETVNKYAHKSKISPPGDSAGHAEKKTPRGRPAAEEKQIPDSVSPGSGSVAGTGFEPATSGL